MITEKDKEVLLTKGISEQQIKEQLERFKTGFPFLKIEKPATADDGIEQIESSDISFYLEKWKEYQNEAVDIVKFVPSSGAASRMFKDLFEFYDSDYKVPQKEFEQKFFSEIKKFAFYGALNAICLKNCGKYVDELIEEGDYKSVVANLLFESGLNYGALPKGLLQFHAYGDESRTPMEEHLMEGALYAKLKTDEVNMHFTVSKEHRELFDKLQKEKKNIYEEKFGVKYNIDFSEQKPSTDTIAADADNMPFRENNNPVFRPGGHGALIENLNDIDADVIFIKNVDNVVPDALRDVTITYKKLLAGILVSVQNRIFNYLEILEQGELTDDELDEIAAFLEEKLNIHNDSLDAMDLPEVIDYLYSKLNRPIRVCGMVKNDGEPGGGPFFVENEDGTVSLQILESSQIDVSTPEGEELMKQSTHFNPVDLVCGVKDYKGKKFNLPEFVDKNTGFISIKSKNGKELKALELPGLWNGAMSDWNTIFVEVPIQTFNPVKTINDLLRVEHQ